MIHSAGLLLHRGNGASTEVLLGHMGGPFWARKDDGAWSIPKGELDPGEDPAAAGVREFAEEMGTDPPFGPLAELGTLRVTRGKELTVFALRGDFDVAAQTSVTFEVEWPPRSGRMRSYPEIDRAAWFDLHTARRKLARGQAPFLDLLSASLQDG